MNRVDTYGLLSIADDTYQILHAFNKAQDRYWANYGTSLDPDLAINDINKCVAGIENQVAKLEQTIPNLTNRPKALQEVEPEYCNALGTYLADLINSMNAFLYFLRLHRAGGPSSFLVRGWRRWKALREFKRCEESRMISGLRLKMAYSLYNIGQHAEYMETMNSENE